MTHSTDYASSDSTYVQGLTATDQNTLDKDTRKKMSIKERVDDWFKRPLRSFKDEDSIITLIVCIPLIEKWVKYQVRKEGKGDGGGFSCTDPTKNRLCLKLAKFLGGISAEGAMRFYECARNGFLHRAMPNCNVELRISPKNSNDQKLVTFEDSILTIYVWALRDKVISEILAEGNHLWTGDEAPILEIFDNSI